MILGPNHDHNSVICVQPNGYNLFAVTHGLVTPGDFVVHKIKKNHVIYRQDMMFTVII